MLTLAAVLLLLCPDAGMAYGHVPLPKPRPVEAPAAATPPSAEEADQQPGDSEPPAAAAKPEPKPAPQLSACRLALTEQIAIAPSIPDIHGAGGCGGEDLVRLEAVVLPDHSRVAVKPAAILRCAMASELTHWIRDDMAPLAARLGSKLADLDNFDSFECRGRNRVVGAKLSEHGRANAIDVRGLKLANGATISLTDRAASREVRETVLVSLCARFTTVLGPGSDWYHEDHVHLDLAQRRGGYRICQWNVWDPLPVVAPLLPAERPEEAPPRAVAVRAEEGAAPAAPQQDAAPAEAEPQPEAEPAPAETAKPVPQATKKRREHRRL
ncbi:extensin family protein [Rhodopseudomonas palustris]|uniref:Extensin-like n=1 Tax=Rhodopseudomonas palustris (strain BisB18) TaxID=316056 RepID=Q20YH1_RHOPB